MKRRHWLIALASLGIAVGGIGAVAFAKPLRLAVPALFGLHCSGRICVERVQDQQAARDLFQTALADVEQLAGLTLSRHSMVFCRTTECYRNFGGGEERAISFPFVGSVIAGHSWQDYIVRHELIHWLQFDRYGAFETMAYPGWFVEGMAYALSAAPQSDIPEQFKPWVTQYLVWQGERSAPELWLTQPVLDRQ